MKSAVKLPRLQLGMFSIATPIGDMLLVCDAQDQLHAADFADCEPRLHHGLERRLGKGNYTLQMTTGIRHIEVALNAYFNGQLSAIDGLVLVMNATPFQQKVWTALRDIAPGTTQAYGAFANMLGAVNSARAIGHANGVNPFNIIVPCHRLVAADGQLTGYAGGLSRKRWLLDHEARYR